MARPSKPANVIKFEKKSHRTKRELATRERAESSLLTGRTMREFAETKENEIAHIEFMRISKLLKAIEKNDDLYANSINRYCMLHAEIVEIQRQKEYFWNQVQELEERQHEFENIGEYYGTVSKLQKGILDLDKQAQSKRTMMLAIEKENVLTIASALRSVPKQPGEKKNPLAEALADEG